MDPREIKLDRKDYIQFYQNMSQMNANIKSVWYTFLKKIEQAVASVDPRWIKTRDEKAEEHTVTMFWGHNTWIDESRMDNMDAISI